MKSRLRYSDAFNNGAFLYYGIAKYDQAIEDFQWLIDLVPKYARGHYGLGLAWHKKKDF